MLKQDAGSDPATTHLTVLIPDTESDRIICMNTDTVNTLPRLDSNTHNGGSFASANTLANPATTKGSTPHLKAPWVTAYPLDDQVVDKGSLPHHGATLVLSEVANSSTPQHGAPQVAMRNKDRHMKQNR